MRLREETAIMKKIQITISCIMHTDAISVRCYLAGHVNVHVCGSYATLYLHTSHSLLYIMVLVQVRSKMI